MSEHPVDPTPDTTSVEAAAVVTEEKVKGERPGKVGALRMLLWQSNGIAVGWNILLLGFLSIYATDTLKVPAALVGTLLLASKLVDAITDVLFGYIVDRTNTRWGRARPYQWGIVGVWLCTWLMFTTPPEWSLAVKAGWIFAMFTLVNAVFMTFINASNPVYLARAFPRTEQHVSISTYGGVIPMLTAVAFNITFPIVMSSMATSAAGWSSLIAIIAIPAAVIGMLRFFTIKETVDVDVEAEGKFHIKDVFLAMKNNNYVLILSVLLLVFSLVSNMGVGVYYYTYIVKNVALMGAVAAIQIIAIPLAFVFPAFIRRFSVRTLITLGLLVSSVGYLISWFAYDNFALLAVGAVLIGGGSVPMSMLPVLMILECADYNEWKGIPRLEGTMGGLTGFANKVGAALGAGLLGWLLTASGYTGDAGTPESSLVMIRLLFTLIPMGLYLALAAMMRLYKLDRMLPQIRRENEERRTAAHLAEEVAN